MLWEGSAIAYWYQVIAVGVVADSRPMVVWGQVAAYANSASATPLATVEYKEA